MIYKDNSFLGSESDFISNHPKIHKNLINRTLKKLVCDNSILLIDSNSNGPSSLDTSSKIFESVDGKIFSGNVLGILGIEDELISLKSRFSSENDDFFTYYLLEKVLGYKVIGLQSGISYESAVYSLLEYIFPIYLDEAMRKGIYKEYVRVSYNDKNIRGSIDVNRHLKQNIPFQGNFSYSTREISYDNDVTQLIRHTIEHLKNEDVSITKRMQDNPQTKKNIDEIIYYTSTYSKSNKQKVIQRNMNKVISHAYFHEYRFLQKICLLILSNKKHTPFNSKNLKYGILFDISWLWEEYVALLLEDKFIHPQNRTGFLKQYLFRNQNDVYKKLIYPDFIGTKQYDNIVADAKYKPEKNIKSSDYHQLLSYMFRFNRNIGFFIHPKKKTNITKTTEELILLDGVGLDLKERSPQIRIQNLKFNIPQNNYSNYTEFSELMKIEEQKFLDKLDNFSFKACY
ncbi:hypothetical protein PT181_03060 [Erysipelothrix rhusiopathiae]|uniref:5-methylcytosine restriction system specificity protein McrC n=1 Tax=Erysipelothrix rhusiopathiae TaxID=1648 RepID=UPI000F4303E8|nr:3-isopropylmalate dehydrogenase [Erysipelothrix rhusiopathiae]AYV34298.1 3-isopropylmalate dehydrogenase [Erysipelothrix rhusiopathiae]MDE8071745.1 hypothetical protein [Erysipelothrix rhusiopathiae]MDE8119577.1 hypothetical protein [Erysipelothrix rhusiopathiae]MDE8132202.1 hypothetical protein [Erysipelothrix rhusiopathiae]MDE8147711.1 hypothetical protein [Erysipelothrix rhusiopathiae]